MSIDKEKLEKARITSMENAMTDNLEDNLFNDIYHNHTWDPVTDLRVFFDYCMKGEARLTNGIWKNQFPNKIINGQKFIDAITKSFEELITPRLRSSLRKLYMKHVYNQHPDPRDWHITIGYFTNTDFLYYNLNKAAECYYINGGNYHIYLSPILVRNVLCSSKCDAKPFIKKVMSYIDNDHVNSLGGHILYATLAKYLGEYCSTFELKKIEKLLLTHLSTESIENYYYHNHWTGFERVDSKNPKYKIMYKKYAEALAALNVEFVKSWEGADIKSHADYIINYCDSVCHAYNLALAIADRTESEDVLLEIVNYVSQNVNEKMSNELIEQLQKPMDERKQVYFIPGFEDEYFADESYRNPDYKELLKKLNKEKKKK